ncbi:MAG: hypothetical protein HKN47_12495 [Pirellulaceae bacterium]|nr:hypothetical protein [Pirellulaceae bacterium]
MKHPLPTGNASIERRASSDGSADSSSGSDRTHDQRSAPRHASTMPVVIIAVLLDGRPGSLHWVDATSVDVSRTGFSFIIDHSDMIPTRTAVVGIDRTTGGREFSSLAIAHRRPTEDGRCRIGGAWVSDTPDDVLQENKLRPRIDPASLSFVYGWSQDLLDAWTQLGVMRRYLVDRVLVCAECGSLPSWRKGCQNCGSGRIHRDRLIHHFACAHVDRASEFERASDLQCPKCRTNQLIVGSDYEFIDGPVECYDCGSRGGQPMMSGMCHRCMERFDEQSTREQLLYGYHVDRIDPTELCLRANAKVAATQDGSADKVANGDKVANADKPSSADNAASADKGSSADKGHGRP